MAGVTGMPRGPSECIRSARRVPQTELKLGLAEDESTMPFNDFRHFGRLRASLKL
jgi:hypothetical protein